MEQIRFQIVPKGAVTNLLDNMLESFKSDGINNSSSAGSCNNIPTGSFQPSCTSGGSCNCDA